MTSSSAMPINNILPKTPKLSWMFIKAEESEPVVFGIDLFTIPSRHTFTHSRATSQAIAQTAAAMVMSWTQTMNSVVQNFRAGEEVERCSG